MDEHVAYMHAECAMPRQGYSLSFQINQREIWETPSI